jgi:predicted MPP superfamily phosphohydrolase
MKRVLKWLSVIVLTVLALCLFEVYASENFLTVNQFSYDSEKIDTPVRIVILSDLHNHDFGEKLPEMVKDQNPDLILMAGDMIDHDKKDENQVFELVRTLCQTAPVYYAVGNHEERYLKENPEFLNQVETAGAMVIEKNTEDIIVNNNKIRIGGLYAYPFGMTDNNAGSAPAEIKTYMESFTDTDMFKIFLAHRPDSFVFGDVSKVYDIDLVVSGHIHGGQVIIPFIGGLYGGDQGWFPEYYHGLYEKDKLKLIITSGLSSSKKKLPRFNNIPEVLVLTIN